METFCFSTNFSNTHTSDHIQYEQDRGMKIHIKQPEVLPKSILLENKTTLLAAISKVRDRALIFLLLRTGMRIGELLNVKVADITLPERKPAGLNCVTFTKDSIECYLFAFFRLNKSVHISSWKGCY